MIKETLIFLHIPKTGGRTLQNILLRQYSDRQALVNAHESITDISKWSDDRRRNIRYIQGHFSYGVHKLFPQTCTYITMLRDPVDRVVSHYHFVRRNSNHMLNKVVMANDMSLEDYVKGGVCDEVSNDQMRLIAGVPRDSVLSESEVLNIAKDNLVKRFLLAGLVEKFDETLVLLKKRIGLKNIYYGVRNQTIGRPIAEQLPESTLRLITERNLGDIELYAYAKEKLISMMREDVLEFDTDLRRFRMLNRPYSSAFYMIRNIKRKLINS